MTKIIFNGSTEVDIPEGGGLERKQIQQDASSMVMISGNQAQVTYSDQNGDMQNLGLTSPQLKFYNYITMEEIDPSELTGGGQVIISLIGMTTFYYNSTYDTTIIDGAINQLYGTLPWKVNYIYFGHSSDDSTKSLNLYLVPTTSGGVTSVNDYIGDVRTSSYEGMSIRRKTDNTWEITWFDNKGTQINHDIANMEFINGLDSSAIDMSSVEADFYFGIGSIHQSRFETLDGDDYHGATMPTVMLNYIMQYADITISDNGFTHVAITLLPKSSGGTQLMSGANLVAKTSTSTPVSVPANTLTVLNVTDVFAKIDINTYPSSQVVTDAIAVNTVGQPFTIKEGCQKGQSVNFDIVISTTPNFAGNTTGTFIWEIYSNGSSSVVRTGQFTATSSMPTGYSRVPHTIKATLVADEVSLAQGYTVRLISDRAFTYDVSRIVRNINTLDVQE